MKYVALVFTLLMTISASQARQLMICKFERNYQSSGTAYVLYDDLKANDLRIYFQKSKYKTDAIGSNLSSGECGLTSRRFLNKELNYLKFNFNPKVKVKISRDGKSKIEPVEFTRKVKNNKVQVFWVEKDSKENFFEILE